jgi:predicted  nucleic acid-binding Zn-ribbon protein
MNFGFVSRKTYNILQENCNKINRRRIEKEEENKKLQREILKLKQELKNLQEQIKVTNTVPMPKKKTTRKTTKKEEK